MLVAGCLVSAKECIGVVNESVGTQKDVLRPEVRECQFTNSSE